LWAFASVLLALVGLTAIAVDAGYGMTKPLTSGHEAAYPMACADNVLREDCFPRDPVPGELYTFEISLLNAGPLPINVERIVFGPSRMVIVDDLMLTTDVVPDVRRVSPFEPFLLQPQAERVVRVVAHAPSCMTVRTDGGFQGLTGAHVTYRLGALRHTDLVDIGDILTFHFDGSNCP
jgi:hypothetical protein